jgi:6-pyruvoyltetrahydropterin/6-carboxytetrahydropterin synthase
LTVPAWRRILTAGTALERDVGAGRRFHRAAPAARKDDATMSMIVALVHRFRFEAAHHLPKVPPDHKCRRLHGHGYEVEVEVEGPVDPETGWYMDFADIARAAAAVRADLDHRVLNDVQGLENPTAEMLSAWIWERLKGSLPGLERISILETCACRCDYRGPRRRGD